MSDLTERTPANTYRSLLKIDDKGLDGALRSVETGDGTKSPVKLSTEKIDLEKNALMIDGVTVSATANELNALNQGIDGGTF